MSVAELERDAKRYRYAREHFAEFMWIPAETVMDTCMNLAKSML